MILDLFFYGVIGTLLIALALSYWLFKEKPTKSKFWLHLWGRLGLQYVLGLGIWFCFTSGNWLLYITGFMCFTFFILHIILIFDRETLESALIEFMMKMLSRK